MRSVTISLGAALVATLGVAGPAQAAGDASTYSVTDVAVSPVAGAYPYAPVFDGTLSQDWSEGDPFDCVVNGREIPSASTASAQGCGGVDISVTFQGGTDVDYTRSPAAQATVTRVYGCENIATHKQRKRFSAKTSHAHFLPATGGYYLASGVPTAMYWIAPMETVSCRAGENPVELSVRVTHLVAQVYDASQPVYSLQQSIAQPGSWYTRSGTH